MAKDELVLLYQLDPATEKGLRVREILSRLNIPVRTIRPDMLSQTIGQLAGLSGQRLDDQSYTGDLVPDEVMLMNNLSDTRIDRILQDFREGGVSRIALKAVVTRNNQGWTLLDLIKELRSEHEIMSRYSLLNQAVQAGDRLLAEVPGPESIHVALSPEGKALTGAIAEGRVILRAMEAPGLPVIEAALTALTSAIGNFKERQG